MVEGHGREAPRPAIERCSELVELAGVTVLQHGPRKRQRHADVQQNLAQHTISGPMASSVGMDLIRLGRVLVDHPFQRRVGDDEARPAMSENRISNLRLSPDVQRILRVELLQPRQ